MRATGSGEPAIPQRRFGASSGVRGQAVAGFIAALVALLAIQAFPQVVAAIVGLWLAAIVLLFVALAIGSRGTKQ